MRVHRAAVRPFFKKTIVFMQQRVVINDLYKVAVCIWMAFTATMAVGANSSGDSIKVVKGQVSDYYIPVVKEYTITGTVSDENGKALEGATVKQS